MTNTMGRKILYDGKPVQVDSAIRDATGRIISSTYETIAQAVEYYEYTQAVDTSQDYSKAISAMGFTNGKTPRIIQVFRPVTVDNVTRMSEIQTDTYITSTNVIIHPTTISPQETWTVRVTAW